ncbi:MAG: (Fe-S)-binding protein [Clostridia bacterium]|nr:(Fe-S)-binding protein [Clostridia bacterium]
MKTLFAPGCALNQYKPELISKLSRFLKDASIIDDVTLTCCKSGQKIDEPVTLITCCPGCSHKFETQFPAAQVFSLWKALLSSDFCFPDYHGVRMSIHDSCHSRHRHSSEMQDSVRLLCSKMNIELVEPEHTRDDAGCCGGCTGDYETRKEMAARRAGEFPENQVVVYCTGCTRSFSITNVKPRHILDLLFSEPTEGLYPPKNAKE